jgi:hypothetical protein
MEGGTCRTTRLTAIPARVATSSSCRGATEIRQSFDGNSGSQTGGCQQPRRLNIETVREMSTFRRGALTQADSWRQSTYFEPLWNDLSCAEAGPRFESVPATEANRPLRRALFVVERRLRREPLELKWWQAK